MCIRDRLQIVYTNESFLWNGCSKRNISGVLMSVGLVSDWHQSNSDDLQTYISRDSGISWTKAFDMEMKYAFSESRDIIPVSYTHLDVYKRQL